MSFIPKEFKQFGAKLMSVEFIITSPDSLMQVSGYVHDHFEAGGKPLKLSVKSAGRRSLSQNQLMWMWLGELSIQIKKKSGESYSSDDLHEYMKARFCPAKNLRFGKKDIQITSTTRLDTGEMTFYLNQIHEWAVNAGFKLTVPIESEYRQLIERQHE